MYLFSLVYSILQKERRYENDNYRLYRKYSYKSYEYNKEKNQCADLLLFYADILINNSENNNYEKI